MSTHTPGPWIYAPDRGFVVSIATAMPRDVAMLPRNSEADARLIAAAPDLLAERDRLRAEKVELVRALEWSLPRVDCTHLSGSALSAYQDASTILIKRKVEG